MVPTITTLLKIATALDRPVSYFVESDEGPRPVAFTGAIDPRCTRRTPGSPWPGCPVRTRRFGAPPR